MDFWSSAWDSVCSAVSSVCSVAGSFARGLGTSLSIISSAIDIVCQVAKTIGQALGIVAQKQDIPDIGDRAIQAEAAGIVPEKFEKYDEYLAAIQNFKLDPERSKEISMKDKQWAGISVVARGIEEKFDLQTGTAGRMMILAAGDSGFFTGERMLGWLKSGNLSMDRVADYFDRKLDGADSMDMEEQLILHEKASGSPDSDSAIETRILEARDKYENHLKNFS